MQYFFFSICLYSCIQKSEHSYGSLSQNEINEINAIFEEISELEEKYASTALDMTDSLLDIEEKQFCSLNSIVDKKKLLILHFSSLDCSVCVDSVFKCLEESGINSSSFAILCNISSNSRNVGILKERYNFKGRVYKILSRQGVLNDLDNRIHKPYFFVLDSSLCLKDFFIPTKYDTDRLKKYLDYIYKSNIAHHFDTKPNKK